MCAPPSGKTPIKKILREDAAGLQGGTADFNQTKTLFRSSFEASLKHKLGGLKEAYAESSEMIDAVLYSSLTTGGKRIRPLLTYASAMAVSATQDGSDANISARVEDAAISAELIHTYSLIHDDLPIMDDDDMRRNMPSCHKKFGEANAILAGDMLQVLAFDRLMQNQEYDLQTKHKMIQILVHAALDMVSGQALDLIGEDKQLTVATIERMYELKTAALITASLQLGALAAGVADKNFADVFSQLTRAGKKIGVAFQIQDDLLDLEAEPPEQEKSTYPNAVGEDAARQRKGELLDQARADIAALNEQADFLRYIFTQMCERSL